MQHKFLAHVPSLESDEITFTIRQRPKHREVRIHRAYSAPLAVLLTLAGCGSDGPSSGGTPPTTLPVSTTPTPVPTPAPAPAPTPPPPPPQLSLAIEVRPSFVPDWTHGEQVHWSPHDPAWPRLTGTAECVSISLPAQPGALCEVASLRLIERDRVTRVESEIARLNLAQDEGRALHCDFAPDGRQVGTCRGANYWRMRNGVINYYHNPEEVRPDGQNGMIPLSNSRVTGGVLVIATDAFPDRVAHWWTAIDVAPWRPPSSFGGDYIVELTFRTTDSVIRIGLDGYRENADNLACALNCYGIRNREAFVSGWWATTGTAFVTLRFPSSLR